LKEDFIERYYPAVKILHNRDIILSFRQSDNEHMATALGEDKSNAYDLSITWGG
jgi:hypothetical protein